MMAKKDYERAAEIVRTGPIETQAATYEAFGLLFSSDNPAFDKARFFNACFPAPRGAKMRPLPKNRRVVRLADEVICGIPISFDPKMR